MRGARWPPNTKRVGARPLGCPLTAVQPSTVPFQMTSRMREIGFKLFSELLSIAKTRHTPCAAPMSDAKPWLQACQKLLHAVRKNKDAGR